MPARCLAKLVYFERLERDGHLPFRIPVLYLVPFVVPCGCGKRSMARYDREAMLYCDMHIYGGMPFVFFVCVFYLHLRNAEIVNNEKIKQRNNE